MDRASSVPSILPRLFGVSVEAEGIICRSRTRTSRLSAKTRLARQIFLKLILLSVPLKTFFSHVLLHDSKYLSDPTLASHYCALVCIQQADTGHHFPSALYALYTVGSCRLHRPVELNISSDLRRSRTMPKKCSQCDISLEKVARSSYHKKDEIYYCHKCYAKHKKPCNHNESGVLQQNLNDDVDRQSSEIYLPIFRSHLSHNKCIFNCVKFQNSQQLSREKCIEIYSKSGVFVPYGARACSEHFVGDSLKIPEQFTSNLIGISLTSNDIVHFFQTTRNMITAPKTKISILDMKSDLLMLGTGLNNEQFKELLSLIEDENLHVINNWP